MVASGSRTMIAGSLSSCIAGFHQSCRFSQSSGPRRSCVGTGPAFAATGVGSRAHMTDPAVAALETATGAYLRPSTRQFGQDIASIQRLGSRSEPLGAGGRTAPAAIVDRQLQNLQQCMNLAPRYQMGRIWIDGGHEVAKGIQRGEPAREKIAIDRAFMEAGRDPKAHLER